MFYGVAKMIVSVAWLLSFAIDAILVASMFERRTVLSSFAPSVMLVLSFDCALFGPAVVSDKLVWLVFGERAAA